MKSFIVRRCQAYCMSAVKQHLVQLRSIAKCSITLCVSWRTHRNGISAKHAYAVLALSFRTESMHSVAAPFEGQHHGYDCA